MEIWHKRIKELRENTDITLKDMAKLIGVSEATVQRYENGKIQELPYKAITTYAEKFNVTPGYIMGWENKSSDLITNNVYKNQESTKDKEEPFSEDIRLAARNMMSLSDSDKLLAINMIKALAQKGKDSQNN